MEASLSVANVLQVRAVIAVNVNAYYPQACVIAMKAKIHARYNAFWGSQLAAYVMLVVATFRHQILKKLPKSPVKQG